MIRRSFLKRLAVLLMLAAAAVPSNAERSWGEAQNNDQRVPGGRTTRRKRHFHFFTATRSLKLATKFKSFSRRSRVSHAKIRGQCSRPCRMAAPF